jgi:radical SAM protein with 4Fe4S-binding SPASM domain
MALIAKQTVSVLKWIGDLPVLAASKNRRVPLSFELEITARCNCDCRHCYINQPAADGQAKAGELSLTEIERIAGEAADMGALWCLLTGGEPLLREDFADVYLALKRKGLLVSVFTNATLITARHVELWQKHPPRDVEVTVYGATRETYERVTRRPGSFDAFRRGLDLLLAGGIKVRLKAMALRSNVHELPAIARFCRERTKDYFRFDPLLHLRFDGNKERNQEIRAERLAPSEIVEIERNDDERFQALQKDCARLTDSGCRDATCDHLIHCGAGNGSFVVGYDGKFRLCSALWHPDTITDLRHTTLREAWEQLVPRVRDMRSQRPKFLDNCRRCPLVNLCLWCPAHAHLETGELDACPEYFCQVAHERARAIEGHKTSTSSQGF